MWGESQFNYIAAHSVVTVQLMKIVGIILAGGLLLLWVAWKLWREIEEQRKARVAGKAVLETATGEAVDADPELPGEPASAASPRKKFRQAIGDGQGCGHHADDDRIVSGEDQIDENDLEQRTEFGGGNVASSRTS